MTFIMIPGGLLVGDGVEADPQGRGELVDAVQRQRREGQERGGHEHQHRAGEEVEGPQRLLDGVAAGLAPDGRPPPAQRRASHSMSVAKLPSW
jgi:hypothetical protein